MSARHVMRPSDVLHIRSMGKWLRVTAIFTDDAEANAYMDKHSALAVVASFGPFVFVANRFDKGEA